MASAAADGTAGAARSEEGAAYRERCPCEARGPVGAVSLAVVAFLAIVVAYYLAQQRGRDRRDRFVSPQAREIYARSREVFERTRGGATYSNFKAAVGTDPVTYTDVRRLWQEGRLSPESVQAAL